jgi:hypothetical protein
MPLALCPSQAYWLCLSYDNPLCPVGLLEMLFEYANNQKPFQSVSITKTRRGETTQLPALSRHISPTGQAPDEHSTTSCFSSPYDTPVSFFPPLSLSSPLMPNPIPRPGEERREWLRGLSVPCNSCELPLSNTGVGGTELSAERRTAALSRIAPAPDQQPKRRSTYRYIHDRTGITWRRRQFHRRD